MNLIGMKSIPVSLKHIGRNFFCGTYSIIEHCFASRGLVTSIGYRGNGKAYTTHTRTLFDRFTLFVYDPFVYPSDIYFSCYLRFLPVFKGFIEFFMGGGG